MYLTWPTLNILPVHPCLHEGIQYPNIVMLIEIMAYLSSEIVRRIGVSKSINELWHFCMNHWFFTKYFMCFVMAQHIFLSIIICTKARLNFKHLSREYFKLIISSRVRLTIAPICHHFYFHVHFHSPLLFLTIVHPHFRAYLNNSKMKLRHNYKVFNLKPEVIHHSFFVISYDFEGKFKQK